VDVRRVEFRDDSGVEDLIDFSLRVWPHRLGERRKRICVLDLYAVENRLAKNTEATLR